MDFKAEDFKDDKGFQDYIADTTKSAVETAVSELKKKNSEIIGEKKKLQDMISKFDGLDLDKAKQAMDFVEKNETAKLIAEGKSDEVIEQLTEKLRAKHQEQIDDLQKKLGEIETSAKSYKTRYEQRMVDDAIRVAATKAGVLPEAVDDVLLRARAVFSHGEDGTIEARNDKGELLKIDDKLLTPDLWVTKLPRHYWPASSGTNFDGKDGASKLDAQLEAAAKSGDMTKYRALRKRKSDREES